MLETSFLPCVRRLLIGTMLGAGLGSSFGSQSTMTELAQVRELLNLSLEDLSNIVVTSVSRREERLANSAASVYVITAEQIRRSGATSLPEVLRLAPNLDVARAGSTQYAISSRGFNNVLANKLLVLIDGRTVYTPLYSGVFWEAQEVMLEDVERIEVISGPGATLWGANAVNGVINVITRRASDTQGTLVGAIAGNRERGLVARHGAAFAGGGHYRIHARTFEGDAMRREGGGRMQDAYDRAQVGFRADWGTAEQGFTLHGDVLDGETDQRQTRRQFSGANLVARWNMRLASGAGLRVQTYYERTDRELLASFGQRLDTYDVEVQHSLQPLGAHRLIWGAGYREARDRITNSAAQAFLPAARNLRWQNIFV